MALVLTNELEAEWNKYKDLVGEKSHEYVAAAISHYDSWRGWVGRNSWYVLPAIAAVCYALGKYAHYLHCK